VLISWLYTSKNRLHNDQPCAMKAYPLLPFDQHILGGAEGFTDTEQRSKGGASALATVEAEDEFVEVGWQVFPAESVIDVTPSA
jgi:hypothetical protein